MPNQNHEDFSKDFFVNIKCRSCIIFDFKLIIFGYNPMDMIYKRLK